MILSDKTKKIIKWSLAGAVIVAILVYAICSLLAKPDTIHEVPNSLNPIFLQIGEKLQIRWYAVCILTGAALVAFWGYFGFFKRVRFDADSTMTGATWGIVIGVLGARLYYVLFGYSSVKEGLMDFFNFTNGGLAIHGAIYATIIFIIIFCRIKKLKLLNLVEIVMPFFLLAQAVGRWGNFFNQEAFGPIVNGYTEAILSTEQLIAQRLTLRHFLVPNFVIDNMYLIPHGGLIGVGNTAGYYHPTFFYESVLNIVGALGIIAARKHIKKLYVGDSLLLYLIWYGAVRFFIESLRTDPLMVGNIRVAQLTSIIYIVVGIILMILRRVLKFRLESSKEFIYEGGTMWQDENKNAPATDEETVNKVAINDAKVLRNFGIASVALMILGAVYAVIASLGKIDYAKYIYFTLLAVIAIVVVGVNAYKKLEKFQMQGESERDTVLFKMNKVTLISVAISLIGVLLSFLYVIIA